MNNKFDHDMLRSWFDKTSGGSKRKPLVEKTVVSTDYSDPSMNVHKDKQEQFLDSLDQMIDSLLISYETDSTQKDNLSLENAILQRTISFLFEQDEEEEADDTTDNSEQKTDVPAESPDRLSQLDIDRFTGKVYRLLSNYDNILDIKSVIVNRAKNYLENTYSSDVSNEFLTNLEQTYDVSIGNEDETPETPYAIGAGPGLGGGA